MSPPRSEANKTVCDNILYLKKQAINWNSETILQGQFLEDDLSSPIYELLLPLDARV